MTKVRRRMAPNNEPFVVLLLTAVLCGCFVGEGTGEDSQMTQLVKKWKTRDGAQTVELSYELSKSLVSCDSLFYQVMSLERGVLSSWLDELQYGTFTIYEADDEVEIVLYQAYYSRLKELMIRKNHHFLQHPEYGDIAEIIREKLEKITIRAVD